MTLIKTNDGPVKLDFDPFRELAHRGLVYNTQAGPRPGERALHAGSQRALPGKEVKDFNQRAAVADTLTGVRKHQLRRLYDEFCTQTGRQVLASLAVYPSTFDGMMDLRWRTAPAFCKWLLKQKGKKRGNISPALVNEVAKVYEMWHNRGNRTVKDGVPVYTNGEPIFNGEPA